MIDYTNEKIGAAILMKWFIALVMDDTPYAVQIHGVDDYFDSDLNTVWSKNILKAATKKEHEELLRLYNKVMACTTIEEVRELIDNSGYGVDFDTNGAIKVTDTREETTPPLSHILPLDRFIANDDDYQNIFAPEDEMFLAKEPNVLFCSIYTPTTVIALSFIPEIYRILYGFSISPTKKSTNVDMRFNADGFETAADAIGIIVNQSKADLRKLRRVISYLSQKYYSLDFGLEQYNDMDALVLYSDERMGINRLGDVAIGLHKLKPKEAEEMFEDGVIMALANTDATPQTETGDIVFEE